MPEATAKAAKPVCYHCASPVSDSEAIFAEIDGEQQMFCCHGCKSVCQTIFSAGLQGFYQKTTPDETLAPPPTQHTEFEAYDQEAIQDDYVTSHGSQREIHLLIEGIHCPACIWLIEQTLHHQPGVIRAEANFTAKKLRLSWDSQRTTLSAILKRLASVGYAGVPFDPETAEGALARRHRDLLYRMAFAGFCMMNILWVSIALYAGAAEDEFRNWFHWIGFGLATPTLLYSGFPFFRNAFTGLRNWRLTMDLPIAIGATATYLYSVYITVTGSTQGEVFFDTVVNFIFVILIGRYLQAISTRNALSATRRLLTLQPKMATVVHGDDTKLTPIRLVSPGDVVLVRPGETVPVDGDVIAGDSAINESMLTGESALVVKQVGDQVVAGSQNSEGALHVRARAVLRDTALARILDLMEAAQSDKSALQSLADRIVPWFVLITLCLATLTFLSWLGQDFEIALLAAASVLVVTCPCAFGMATPMSIAVASGVGAQRGILVKNGAVLEKLSTVNHVVFDKTGTLTTGELTIRKILPANGYTDEQVLRVAASVEQLSEHAVARAVVNHSQSRGLEICSVTAFRAVPGRGVKALLDGHEVAVGTMAWLASFINVDDVWYAECEEAEKQGISCVLVVQHNTIIGLLGVTDTLREDASQAIAALLNQHIQVSVLSGDRYAVVAAVVAQLGAVKCIAEVLPEDKQQKIRQLQQQGHTVAMVGDGINDSPALIQADVGIAVAAGTDVSIEAADIVLSQNRLMQVVEARRLAGHTLRTIKQNIVLSIIYNLIMVPLAMMAMVSPLMAAVTMPISSLLVIGNAARIGRVK
ncbi:Heavy metal translocating P-type ATPase [Methylophaga frappieri]|uniref:Heavy metal translocating P-type ATPase n=1 Tax=Methylophaga frappieri (strain ATCC BAA-2434 / DSM 25690 / JAM7) TaxID=754477 RepID=I1YFD3_METFJ|nr:heavy metal translocating P-type ATPase [Methylophaga frappieri]AFJ01626.1 Heavy metal translocating P-type ATPase [Methylophaga frappieri]